MSEHVTRLFSTHGDGGKDLDLEAQHHSNYEVEYEHDDEGDFPDEEDGDKKHARHVRVALAKASGTSGSGKSPKKKTIEDTLRSEIENTIDSTRIIIISFFANFVYDIIVNGIGTSDIVFALFPCSRVHRLVVDSCLHSQRIRRSPEK